MKVGILLQYHHPVRVILGQHVRSGTYRIPVKCDVLLCQALLRIKAFGFPWNR